MATGPGRAYKQKRQRQLEARGEFKSRAGADLMAEQQMELKRRQRMKRGSLPEARRLGNDTYSVEVATALHVDTQAGRKLIGALLSKDPPTSWKELMEPLTVKALERILYVDADYWKGDILYVDADYWKGDKKREEEQKKREEEHKKREDTFNKFHEAIDTSRIQTLRKILSKMVGGRKVSSTPWYKKLLW